jgi:Ser/Thr protein kinase RdoA (MazF antagonist)
MPPAPYQPEEPLELCRRWFPRGPVRVAPLAGAGFSGARVFRVAAEDAGGEFVLKSFAAAASHDHAAWVHAFAGQLRGAGIDAVPAILPPPGDAVAGVGRRVGGTLVVDGQGTLWEMLEFKPGRPVPAPEPAAAAAAAALLARVHLAAGRLPGRTRGRSPGLARRIAAARDLRADPWGGRLERRPPRRRDDSFTHAVAARVAAAAEAFAAAGLGGLVATVAELEPRELDLQPVLRDVWCDHVLFAAAEPAGGRGPAAPVVTGLIDLHAAGIDTPATDLARLFGSWQPAPGRREQSLEERWPGAFAAYERVRPLTDAERGLVGLLHAAGVVAGLDRWFRWTLDEDRGFPDEHRALDRIDTLIAELSGAVAVAARGR